MHDESSNHYRLLIAVAASVCAFFLIRYASLTVTFLSAGRTPAAVGFLLMAGISALCLIGAGLLVRQNPFAGWLEETFKSWSVPLCWLITALIAIPVLVFAVPEGWDEARHIQYGMFLRGYSMPGEQMAVLVVRSPLASFLAAIFFPFTQIINPLLLVGLVAVMIAWCRRYAHPAMVVFALLLFMANDHFMQAIWAVMGELPGALFLVAAFYLLSRDRFALCALCFAFAVLARWNLAPFAMIGVAFVALRISMRHALIMAAVGAAIFAMWLAQAWILVGSPMQFLMEYAAHAHEFTEPGGLRPGERPSVRGRLDFYIAAHFFQTLPALLAIPVSFFIPRNHRGPAVGELFRYWIPASLLFYFLCMVCTGGYYPRLAVVTFPLSLLLLAEVLHSIVIWCRIVPRLMIPVLLTLLPIGAATGVQGYDIVPMIGRKVLVPPPLPASLAETIRANTTKRDTIVMPKFYKITRQSGGRHLKVHVRRGILIYPDLTNPSFDLMFSRTLDDEIRDFEVRVGAFLEAVPPGMYFLLPSRYRDRIAPNQIVFEQDEWILGQVPE